jgi:UDP-N-acetyl-D-galactosamine dehydrogenase
VTDIVAELRRFGADPVVVDPVADAGNARHAYDVSLTPLQDVPRCEAVIAAVAHTAFAGLDLAWLAGRTGAGAPFLDIKGAFDRTALARHGFTVWRL